MCTHIIGILCKSTFNFYHYSVSLHLSHRRLLSNLLAVWDDLLRRLFRVAMFASFLELVLALGFKAMFLGHFQIVQWLQMRFETEY